MNKVPKLRFKEFSEEWEEKRLGEVSEIIMGQSPSSSKYNENFNGLPLIQGNADCKNRKVFPRIYTTEITKESFPNDIIMTVRAPVGAISLSNIHSCIGRGVCAIRNASNFIYHYLIKLEDSWDKLAQGSTFTAVNSNNIKNLKINLPLLQEQEKIADFLSSVDKKISIIEEKLDLFKDYKKGIMQKIFKQELRFKDSNGNDYPEWEEKRLGDVFSFKQGYQIPFKEQIKIKEKGYVRYLYISDFFSDKNLLYVKDDGKEKITETDITVANTGNTAGSFYRGKSGILSNNMFNIQNDEKVVTNDFLFQFLGTSLYSNQLKTFFNSSGQPHLGHKNMSMIIINYPVSFEEQQKIANFLSSIDKKNDNLATELENLKEFKKGLLQQMFI